MVTTIEFGGAGGFWLALSSVFGSELDHRAFVEPLKAARRIAKYQYGANAVKEFSTDGIGRKERAQLICGRLASAERIAAGPRQRVAPKSGVVHAVREAAAALRAEWIVLDAPADLLAHSRSREFQALLGLVTGHVPEIPRGGWRSAGFAIASGDAGYTAHWRVLDLAGFDLARAARDGMPWLPHSRARLYIVCARGRDGRAEILLDGAPLGGIPETLETETDHAALDVGIAAVYPFTWRAGGFMNSPVVQTLTLPTIAGDNVAIAVERRDGAKFVRRLTPENIEAAFDFPEGFTELGKHENGKIVTMSDRARYETMKSATAPAPLRWMFERMFV